MQFEDGDNFDDIVSVIQDKLQGLSGVLHVAGIADNAPDHLLPVQNWLDFHYFRAILETKSVLDTSSKDIDMDFVWVRGELVNLSLVRPSSKDIHMDFVWVSAVLSLQISRVVAGNYNWAYKLTY